MLPNTFAGHAKQWCKKTYISTLYFTTIVTRFFDETEIFISLDASF